MKKSNISELQSSGVTVVDFITPGECGCIIAEASTKGLTRAADVFGKRKVRQNFYEAELSFDLCPNLLAITQKLETYLIHAITHLVGTYCFNPNLTFTEARVHQYMSGDGLEYHSDSSYYKNLVVSVLLQGESSFYIADDFLGTNERKLEASVGQAVLIAAPGLFGKQLQPPHKVFNDTEWERWSLGLRQLVRPRQ